ncbi:hypothetical protein VP1G_04257 [Cytospora mali]|uniref:Uncharacterized protein n=1 Tax=Cytospora mali TaxID=578113 RepID=A0A194UZ18_CYTMA|nr:hypothetical protein VP1G_04257 [Valsa mali var. pyri (nom. inval.)]
MQQVEKLCKDQRYISGIEGTPVTALETAVSKIWQRLEDFNLKLHKYATSLAEEGSGNVFKDTARKIQTYTRVIDIGEDNHNPTVAPSPPRQSGHPLQGYKIERDAIRRVRFLKRVESENPHRTHFVTDPESKSNKKDIRVFDRIILVSQRTATVTNREAHNHQDKADSDHSSPFKSEEMEYQDEDIGKIISNILNVPSRKEPVVKKDTKRYDNMPARDPSRHVQPILKKAPPTAGFSTHPYAVPSQLQV